MSMIKTINENKMRIEFAKFSIEMYKNRDDSYGNNITFFDKSTNTTYSSPFSFLIDWDNNNENGRIELRQRDRWGSEMRFIYYSPSDLEGMFRFIARGFKIPIS